MHCVRNIALVENNVVVTNLLFYIHATLSFQYILPRDSLQISSSYKLRKERNRSAKKTRVSEIKR